MPDHRLRLPLVPRWLRWSLVAAVLATLLVFSVVRPPGTTGRALGPLGVFPLTAWLHAIGYAGLAFVLAYALQTSPRPDWQILCVVFAFVTAYGAGIELIQSTLAYRTFDVGDILVNALGAAVAVIGWKLLVRRVQFYRCRRADALRPPLG
jgi:VanZ family protein